MSEIQVSISKQLDIRNTTVEAFRDGEVEAPRPLVSRRYYSCKTNNRRRKSSLRVHQPDFAPLATTVLGPTIAHVAGFLTESVSIVFLVT